MADVQLDNGYTRIADELIEALARSGLTGRQLRVVLAVIRKTYGFGKTKDRISSGQLSELTGIAPNKVRDVLIELVAMRVVRREASGRTSPQMLSLNKDHDQWTPKLAPPRGRPVEGAPRPGGQTSPVEGAKLAPPAGHTIDNKQKTVRMSGRFLPEDHPAVQLRRRFVRRLVAEYPDHRIGKRPESGFRAWDQELERLLRIDKRDARRVARLIDWSTSHPFWKANVQSPEKLRKQWERLELQMAREKGSSFKAQKPTTFWEDSPERREQMAEVTKGQRCECGSDATEVCPRCRPLVFLCGEHIRDHRKGCRT